VASPVVVRSAVPEDFDAWFELFEAVAGEGRWIGAEAPVDREHHREGFLGSIDVRRAARFVAERDDLVVGELYVGRQMGVADLGMLVRSDHRGTGVGSALLAGCLEWCQRSRVHKVTLHVFPHNEAAIALYRKFGFTEEGRLVRHYRRSTGELWDAIAMARILDTTSPGCSLGE